MKLMKLTIQTRLLATLVALTLSVGCASTPGIKKSKLPAPKVRQELKQNKLTLMSVIPPAPSPEAMNNAIGHFYNALGAMNDEPELAVKSLKLAVMKVPGFHAAHYNLALMYHRFGDTKKAKEELFKIIRAEIKSEEAYNALGVIYMDESKYNEAARAFNYANSIKEQPSTYINLANVYQLKDDNERAMEFYKKAEAMEPDSPYIHFNVGALLLKSGDLERATRRLKKALPLKLSHPEVVSLYAKALLLAGDVDDALELYRGYAILNPQLAEPHKNMGIIYEIYKKDYIKALRHYKLFMALAARDVAKNNKVADWIRVVEQMAKRQKR